MQLGTRRRPLFTQVNAGKWLEIASQIKQTLTTMVPLCSAGTDLPTAVLTTMAELTLHASSSRTVTLSCRPCTQHTVGAL